MDTWQEEQVKRMQLGGNFPFKEFIKSYSADQGGYNDQLSPYDRYHCWAAAQYREKLDAMLAGKEWSPSPPPPEMLVNQSSPKPSSAQTLRRSRTSARTVTGNSLRSESPSPFRGSPQSATNLPSDQNTTNETYFETLGKLNDARPDNLPPSQGGRYKGFGNSSTPQSSRPSFPLSSSAAPSLSELQENPLGAISKGWSLFSAAVAGATKSVSENVIQPGIDKITDPGFQESIKGYVSEAQKRAVDAGGAANQWSKHQLGVDVAEGVGGVVDKVKDRIAGPSRSGYGVIPTSHEGETSALYHDLNENDFFGESTSRPFGEASIQRKSVAPEKDDWDNGWKDF